MGCPQIYTNNALRNLLIALYSDENNKTNDFYKLLNNEEVEFSEDTLKTYVINYLTQTDDLIEFIFLAGKSFEYTLNDADRNDGNDGFNACIAGLIDYEKFIKEIIRKNIPIFEELK